MSFVNSDLITYSGGGVRAMFGTLIAHDHHKFTINNHSFYGVSGGAWGLSLLMRNKTISDLNIMSSNVGPSLNIESVYHSSWRESIRYYIFETFGLSNIRYTELYDNESYLVVRTDELNLKYLDHCVINNKGLHCTKEQNIQNLTNENGEMVTLLDILTYSSSVFACKWEHIAMRLNFKSKGSFILSNSGTINEKKFYLADGACEIGSPLFYEVKVKRIDDHEVIRNFDFSVPLSTLLVPSSSPLEKLVMRTISELSPNLKQLLVNSIKCGLLYPICRTMVSNKTFINTKLFGFTLKNKITEVYPTMISSQVKQWSISELSDFIYEWSMFLRYY